MSGVPDYGNCPGDAPEYVETIERIRAAVFGNGDPEHSLLVRMANVERKLRTIERVSYATLCGVGALVARLIVAGFERVIGG